MKNEFLDILLSFKDDENISLAVYENAKKIISEIDSRYFTNNLIDSDDIYYFEHGTVAIDFFCKNIDDTLCLEIGKDTFGYFVEVDGKDVKFVDKITFSDIKELISDLENFKNK